MAAHRSPLRRLRGAALAALLALLVLAPSAHGYARAVPEGFFGISAPEIYSMSLDGRHTLRDAALEQIAAAGIDSVRTEAGWWETERQAPVEGGHVYDWTEVDRLVGAMAEHGLRPLAQFNAPPRWAQPEASADACGRRGGIAREHVGDFAAYAGAYAGRYGRGGSYWEWAAANRPGLPQRPVTTYELWNEPNWVAFWCPRIDPETFAEMVAAAADAIHAADPAATVTIGGLVLIPDNRYYPDGSLEGMGVPEFLGRAMAHRPDLAAKVDAVAIHTYGPTVGDNLWLVAWSRQQLEAAGLGGAELVISELGWHTNGGPGSIAEADRAARLATLVDALARSDCGIASIHPHSWITPRENPSDPEHWFGLADPLTGAPLPSGLAYAEQVALYEGDGPSPAPTAPVRICDGADPAPAGSAPAVEPAGSADAAQPGGAPSLTLLRSPRRRTGDRTPTIRFALDWAVAAEYRLGKRRWRPAGSPLTLARLATGRHTVRLRAVGAAGERSPAKRVRFRVVR